jgi:hypothetical protein
MRRIASLGNMVRRVMPFVFTYTLGARITSSGLVVVVILSVHVVLRLMHQVMLAILPHRGIVLRRIRVVVDTSLHSLAIVVRRETLLVIFGAAVATPVVSRLSPVVVVVVAIGVATQHWPLATTIGVFVAAVVFRSPVSSRLRRLRD